MSKLIKLYYTHTAQSLTSNNNTITFCTRGRDNLGHKDPDQGTSPVSLTTNDERKFNLTCGDELMEETAKVTALLGPLHAAHMHACSKQQASSPPHIPFQPSGP
jgi:hypothetical protein